jgi:GNAT superfamily N-acetyltransferase
MDMINVRDVTESNIDDAFRVCSHNKLDDPLQRQGIELRRRWILDMLNEYGSCVKVAYLDGKPAAQLLFYPEEATPFIPKPRKGVVLLRCVYNPFKEAQGKGVSTSLMKSFVEECRAKPRSLKGGSCRFIATEAFNTGEGIPMEKFYTSNGFENRGDEMILKIDGRYASPYRLNYTPNPQDKNKAFTIYNPTCEYSLPFATRVRDILKVTYPELPVELINQWEDPSESMRLANHWLVVNGVRINSSLHDRETFHKEISRAVEKVT